MTADDRARSTGFSTPVTVRVIRLGTLPVPPPPIQHLRSIVQHFVSPAPTPLVSIQEIRAIGQRFLQRL
jgi:hypothetical protein